MDLSGPIIVELLFIALGILFHYGKGAFLIAGYNTASKEEKARIDKDKLLRSMSKLMFTAAGCFFVAILGTVLNVAILEVLGSALLAISMILGVIRINF